MVDKEIILEWLNKADEDFQFALLNLQNIQNFYGQICFHFQQAAEKYLKAYIVAYELEFEKIHELTKLLKICITHNPIFIELQEACTFLTDFYISPRYPVPLPIKTTKEKAEIAKQMAEKVGKFVKEMLKDKLK